MEGNRNNFTLKLLIDKKSSKVLFAEPSKDVVDFICSLLALPLDAVTKLLTKDANHAMVGSIGNIYDSLGKLPDTYILPTGGITSLLNPSVASTSHSGTNFLLPSATQMNSEDKTIYTCREGYYCGYCTVVYRSYCPSCGFTMERELKFVRQKSQASVVPVGNEVKGYVKGVVTYSVMDDLTVVPMSMISSIVLLNKFQIKDLGSLEERTVSVGFEEGLKLLKASLQSKNVLTDVFLKNDKPSNA